MILRNLDGTARNSYSRQYDSGEAAVSVHSRTTPDLDRIREAVHESAAAGVATASGNRLPAWPARNVDAAEAGSYERLAFTVVDRDGWPTTRTVTRVDLDGEAALLDVPLAVSDGQPGCLLCHWYTPGVEKLGRRLVSPYAVPYCQ